MHVVLSAFPRQIFAGAPTPVEELSRLRHALGRGPRILVKRDDAIPFGFGGNKIRKLEFLIGHALSEGADTLITCGGIQSNHARATASAAARLGLRAVLVLNGERPMLPRGNTLLDTLLGAEIVYVPTREERGPAMQRIAERLHSDGARPYTIPLGASTPRGALGFVAAMEELAMQIPAPDVLIHATSSGGTQAGLIVGCEAVGFDTRVIGISADDPADSLAAQVRSVMAGMADLLSLDSQSLAAARHVHVDDRFVGAGYGAPTAESIEATELAARTEALFLDPTYTAKAMAGLIRAVRDGRFREDETVLFWHTGGLPGMFR
jgi:D-cysteine desulfhydrase family pyridoxal phosphate-dependent enzyme